MNDAALKEQMQRYEQKLSAMVGRRLERVWYYECENDTNAPGYYQESFRGHHLDFGCTLEMEDGSYFGVTWDEEFFAYGIGLWREKSLGDKEWEVTEDEHWVNLIGQTVANVKIYWSWVQEKQVGRDPEKIIYPQEIGIEFGDGSVIFISAAQYFSKDDKFFGISDNIIVLFGLDDAKKYRVGPYGIFEENI